MDRITATQKHGYAVAPHKVPAALDLLGEYEDAGISPNQIRRMKRELDALRRFAVRTDRDYMECDKMFIHVGSLKQDTGYNAYLIDAKQSGAKPLTFEQWLLGIQ